MSKISLKLRIDTKEAWTFAQNNLVPSKGNLIKGEFAGSIENDNKIVIRVGIHSNPEPFNNCPIVFESSLDYVSNDVKIAILNNLPITDSYLVWENNNFNIKIFDDFLSEFNYPKNKIIIPAERKIENFHLYWNNDENIWTTSSIYDTDLDPLFPPTIYDFSLGGNADIDLPDPV